MMKSPDAFRTISEVAAWLGVQAHVLRFWESKFSQVRPVKRAGGRRYYRPSDMRLIGGIKTLLHDEGMTIKGVQKLLREQGVAHVAALSPPMEGEAADTIDAAQEPRGTVLAFKAKPAPDDDADIQDVPTAAPAGALPSFLNRPSSTDMPHAAPVRADKAPPSGSAGGEPPESDLPYTPGVLGHLAGITALSRDRADRIAPLARALRDWYDRTAKAGWG